MANHASHAALPYPVKGARYTLLIPYLDADGDPTDPTTPDTEVSKDDAAAADTTEEVATPKNSVGMLTLTGDETNASCVSLAAKAASGPKTTLATLYPRVLPTIHSGTAQAGAAGTITLASGASAIDDYYNGCIVMTTGGTGGGGGSGSLGNQARVITDYVGSTKVATIEPNWETTPDATTTYAVKVTEFALVRYSDLQAWRGSQPNALVSSRVDASAGAVAAGAIDAAAIATGAIDADAIADNAIDAGALAADAITAAKIANGAIDAATFAAGAIDAAALAADAVAEIADGVWDEATAGHVGAGSFGKLAADVLEDTGTTLQGEVDGIQADTEDIQARLPAALTADGNIKADTLRVGGALQTAGDLSAQIDTVDNFVDTEVSAIKAKSDNLPEGVTKNAILNNFAFFMVDATDHVTGKTGLTVTAERSIDGAAFGACANAVVEVANGVYKINLAAADLNGDIIVLKFTGTGADATVIMIKTEA